MRFLVLLLCALPWLSAQPLVIQHVTVVDTNTGELLPDRAVVVVGDRITAVGPTSRVSTPAGARVINASGKFLIPGLWDMHVHFWYPQHLFPLYLMNGVTGVRDMGSRLERTSLWRREVSSGRMLGPRMITCGPALDGKASTEPEMPVRVVTQPNEARQAADQLEDLKIDFLKVLSDLPRDAYIAIAEHARQDRWPFVGHVPWSMSVGEAVELRQKSIEHLYNVGLSCSREEERLRPRLLEALAKGDQVAVGKISARVLATFDADRARALFQQMARYDTWSVPTLTMLRRSANLGLEQLANEPQLRFLPAVVRKGWPELRVAVNKMSAAERQNSPQEYARNVELVRLMKQYGVKMLAGTDTGDPHTVPGATLHEELALLVEAGLTPLEALQTATKNAAIYLKLENRLGSVERGKFADLVLLTANPLADIRNVRRIAGVVIAGKYLTHAELAAMAGGSAP